MLKAISLPAFASAAILFTSPVRAAIDFAFATDQPNYAIHAGQSATVTLSFVQTGDFALASENGLQGLNFVLQRDDAAGVSPDPATIDTAASAVNFAQFGSMRINDATASDFDVTLLRPFGNSSGPSGASIALATIQINAGATAGITSFRLFDYPTLDETLTYGGTVLDSHIAPADFTVTVTTPEPASMGMVLLGSTALLKRKRQPAV